VDDHPRTPGGAKGKKKKKTTSRSLKKKRKKKNNKPKKDPVGFREKRARQRGAFRDSAPGREDEE